MMLIDVVENLGNLDSESTIYAAEPWRESSEAMVVPEPAGGGLPMEADRHRLKYFLEVIIARDFLDRLASNLGSEATFQEKCARLIQYAINDA